MRSKFVISIISLVLASLSLTTMVFAQKEEDGLDQVTLRMNWFPHADYAMYVIGVKKGFYEDEGIDLKIVPTKGSGLTTKLIGNRQAEFGSASGETTLVARMKGMPLKVLAVLHQTSPVAVVSLKKTGIKEPKDLEGRSLASDPNSMKHKQFEAFCSKNGVDIEKIKILPIKGSNFVHILGGRADAMLAFSYIADSLLRRKGHEINEFRFSDYGIDVYSLSLITNENLIEEDPDKVKRFVSATIKTWNYAVNHPEEALEAYTERYPELKKEDEFYQILGVIDLVQNEYTREHGLGYQAEEKWEKTQDLLYNQDIIDKKINVTELYTNEFLP